MQRLHASKPLHGPKLAEDLLTTTKGGQRLATAVGGAGRDFWTRRPGDLLSPGWTTPQAVDDIRRSLPKEIFEGQYQQNPQFGGSGICSIDRLARFQERSHYELIVHCWDLAGTKSAGDWTVCAKFGLTRDQERSKFVEVPVQAARTQSALIPTPELAQAMLARCGSAGRACARFGAT